MNRRNFIKKLGVGLSVTGLTATGCKKSSSLSLSGTDSDREVLTDKITFSNQFPCECKVLAWSA